jgi:hypothetical protein
MSTVQEILAISEAISYAHRLDDVDVVLHQALYTKTAEIIWKLKDRHIHVFLRLGTFHTIMNVLAIVGKRYQDAGLGDLCIE